MDCPPAEDVQLYLDGLLRAEQRDAIQSHALGCSLCGELLALAATSGAEESPVPRPVVIGARIGRFVLHGLLGAGGMGVVHAAHDSELDRPVALKLLREDSTARRERLGREAQAPARVSHPNVCAVYDIGTHERQLFAMRHRRRSRPRRGPAALRLLDTAGPVPVTDTVPATR